MEVHLSGHSYSAFGGNSNNGYKLFIFNNIRVQLKPRFRPLDKKIRTPDDKICQHQVTKGVKVCEAAGAVGLPLPEKNQTK